MWMLGCILYELCTLHRPFEGESLNMLVQQITRQPFEELDKNMYDPVFNEILSMLLCKNAGFRASVKDVLQLPSLASRVEKFTILNEEMDKRPSVSQLVRGVEHGENYHGIKVSRIDLGQNTRPTKN